MHITTTARHCELAMADREFALMRLEKIDRFARDVQEIHLVVTAESYRHVAEITVRLKGRDVVVRDQSTEVRRAIDLAADSLERQLRRVHERRIARRREARAENGPAEPGAGDTAADEASEGTFGVFEDLEEA